MKKTISLGLLLLFAFPCLSLAQRGKAKDVIAEFAQPEIFLRPVKAIGRTAGRVISLVTDPNDCLDGGVPVPQCFTVPAQPATLVWNEVDIESFVIPAKALRDLLVLDIQHHVNFNLENDTAGDQSSAFRSRIVINIESPAFVGVTDPSTGLPLNGRWTAIANQRRSVSAMHAGEFQADQVNLSRRSFISRSLLKASLTMTDAQIDQFFDNPITIKVSMIGNARLAVDSFAIEFVAIEGY